VAGRGVNEMTTEILDKDTIVSMLESLLEACRQSPNILISKYEFSRGVNEGAPTSDGFKTFMPDSQVYVKLEMSYFITEYQNVIE
jgi:hypothetical protein